MACDIGVKNIIHAAKANAAILKAMDVYIPTKVVSARKQFLPWITREIKIAIRKHNNLFRKAQTSNDSGDRDAYAKQHSLVQSMIWHSYWYHMEHKIVGDDGKPTTSIQKNFWSYIKATKKYRVGTAPHQGQRHSFSDAKNKAEILNKQYQSMFSKEDPTSIPTPSEASFPSMPEIVISQEGVLKLLEDLKENKASGPGRTTSLPVYSK